MTAPTADSTPSSAKTTKAGASGKSSTNVRVVGRIRPLAQYELEKGCQQVLKCLPSDPLNPDGGGSEVIQIEQKEKRWFELDACFDGNSTQQEVYVRSGAQRAVTEDLFQGFNCTILAYGQTGAGKTFTMGTAAGREIGENDGIIPRACADLFKSIQEKCDNNAQGELSYLEVYNEEIRDLLTDDTTTPLRIRETLDGEVYVRGLQSRAVKGPEEIGKFMEEASGRRVVAATKMNATSSRSHAICVLRIKGVLEDDTKFESKLTLVDLAGSERIKKTGAQGGRAQEGININKGLFVLGQVVGALAEQRPKLKRKPPYRDSKLTRLLQDSLGGNSRTIMIACASPADFNVEESINTLRYATSARNIQNTATRNVVKSISPEEAAKLRRENALLKAQVTELQETIEKLTSVIDGSDDEDEPLVPPPAMILEEKGNAMDDDDHAAALAALSPLTNHSRKSLGATGMSLGGFLAATNEDEEVTAVESDEMTKGTVKTVPELEAEVNHLGHALRKAKREIRQSMHGTAIELPMMKVRVAVLEDELNESRATLAVADELQDELAQAKAEAEAAKRAASRMSQMLDAQMSMTDMSFDHKQDMLEQKKEVVSPPVPVATSGYDALKLEESWVTFVGSVLVSFKEQLRLLGDFFDLVVRVVESPDILSMIPTQGKPKKKSGWGWGMQAEEKDISQEEANLRQKLLQEHMHFFNDRFCEVEEELSARSDNLDKLQDRLGREWVKLGDKVNPEIRGTMSRRDQDILEQMEDILLGRWIK